MLHLHRAERADVLAGALCDLLATGLEDPFAPEIVCVPSRGVERWITQQLALVLGASPGGSDGVCANVQFPSPGSVSGQAVAAVSGIPFDLDPWRPERSVWPLLELIESEPGLLSGASTQPGIPSGPAPVAVIDGRSRQYAAARHVADLFDRYAVYRPSMIDDWARGFETDGGGGDLPADLVWQPRLWRKLRDVLDTPSRPERLKPACDALRREPGVVALPSRLSLFGLTRLPPSQLAVLDALAEHRDVHLWLLHPCPPLWDRIAHLAIAGPTRRKGDPSAAAVAHPLLASLGRDVRELQFTVAAAAAPVSDAHHPLQPPPAAQTALAVLQAAIRADARPGASGRPVIEGNDRSIQIHACHGRARQVEVVRDVILGLLAADASLEPRDIVVMCPDIEAFAPLISATFGVGAEIIDEEADTGVPRSPAAMLRVRLADRSLRQTNPVMNVAASLLELVDGRMTASEVLDFAASSPVRNRFGLDDDDLGRLTEWVAQAQVRWGLDAEHRGAFKLEMFGQNTWEAGLDRLLLGVTMADGPAGGDAASRPAGAGWLDRALPLDDVDSTDIDLVGRMAELVKRLSDAVSALSGPQSLRAWIAALTEALDTLTLTSGADTWQTAQLRGELASVVEAAGARADDVTLTLADVRILLGDRLRGRPTRANFRTGSLTMCTLVPMRSVPHRVVCLLGLDDGAFPRQPAIDGDDILLRNPVMGERDERSEDRQLMLDAILAAGEHLVITYAGADERTNAPRPPAVPVGELLDTLEASFSPSCADSVRRQLVAQHPLQPFDPRNFMPDEFRCPQSFSFDPSALAGARAMVAPRKEPGPFLAEPLPPAEKTDLELDSVRMFFEHPVRGFLRQRLGVTLPRAEEEACDQLAVELDGLGRWQIGQRMLDARLSGLDPAYCRAAEWRRGALPPGKLGDRVLTDVVGDVEQIVVEVAPYRQGQPRTVDVAVTLPDGRRLTGTVGSVYDSSIVHTSFGEVNHKRKFRAWLTLLMLTAAFPAEEFRAVAVGRGSSARFGPIPTEQAREWLTDLVALYDSGLCEPLPLASKTSFAYADARRKGAIPPEALKKAATAWQGSRRGERDEAEHVLVHGDTPALDLLCGRPADPSDGAENWPEDTSRFGVLSRRWWDPMLDGEYRAQ